MASEAPLCAGCWINDRSGAGGAWLAAVADQEVLEDQVQAIVLDLIQSGVFEKGDVTGPADFFHFTQHAGRVALEGFQVVTHALARFWRAHSMADRKASNGTSVLACG